MAYSKIEKRSWQSFFDAVSRTVEGRKAELDVIGLDLGDQIETEGLALMGMSYDPKDDAVYVAVDNGRDRHLDHVIRHPKEVHAQMGDTGLSELMIVDEDQHEQFVKLREPLKLPAEASSTPT